MLVGLLLYSGEREGRLAYGLFISSVYFEST